MPGPPTLPFHIGWSQACLEGLQPNETRVTTQLCLSALNGGCRTVRPAHPTARAVSPGTASAVVGRSVTRTAAASAARTSRPAPTANATE